MNQVKFQTTTAHRHQLAISGAASLISIDHGPPPGTHQGLWVTALPTSVPGVGVNVVMCACCVCCVQGVVCAGWGVAVHGLALRAGVHPHLHCALFCISSESPALPGSPIPVP